MVAEYDKAYRILNEARLVAYRANRHSANRDTANSQSKEWRKVNPEKMRALKANYRVRKLCNGGVHTTADIVELLTLQKGLCICCHANLKDGYHVDHRMPLKLEGGNDKYNLQLLCPTCNLSKGSKDPIKFMQSRGFLL